MYPRWPSAALAILAACASARATTYYVAASGGNNANTGSSVAPWATLQFAADQVASSGAGKVLPGDTVIVRSGTYTGFQLTRGGTINSRITFQADPGVLINQHNAFTIDGIDLENVSYVTIDGFNLTGTGNPATSRAGIRVVGDGTTTNGAFARGVTVRNNTADSWGVWGIFTGFAEDFTVENNITSHSAQQHGIYVSNSADRPIIRHNTSFGNAAAGIHMNADINTGNTALARVDGIITGAVVENNIVYDNGAGSAFSAGGGAGINADGIQSSRFQNNLLYNNHASGITLFRIDGAQGSSNNVVANNTIIMASNGRWALLMDESPGNTLMNNIIYDLNTSRGSITADTASLVNMKSDYNFFDGRFEIAGAARTLAQWQAANPGDDTHVHTLTLAQMQALFKNYGTNDFTLKTGSTAIDTGINGLTNSAFMSAPLADLLGLTRPANGLFDAGAFEFAVPEPGSISLLILGTLTFLKRRRA